MRFVVSLAFLVVLGCAGSYYDRYVEEHPAWVPVAPSPGVDVAELAATLHAPPEDDIRQLTLKFVVLRTDVEPWEEHSLEALASGAFEPSADGDYAVVASTSCQAMEQLQSYREVQTSWYLLPKNKLVFWDHSEFHKLCIVSSDYFPARASYVETEHRVAAIAAKYPKRSTYANHSYRKGIALASAGRTDDAEAMLVTGDAEPHGGGETGTQVRFEGGNAIPIDQQNDRGKLRAALVDAIAKAKTGDRP